MQQQLVESTGAAHVVSGFAYLQPERLWGGAPKNGSASSSCNSRPTIELQLPETYFELLVEVCTSPGEEEQGLCLEALLLQTSMIECEGAAHEDLCALEDQPLLRLRKYRIICANGIDPTRLRALLAILRAVSELFDAGVWEENLQAIDALPEYCNRCDSFGHPPARCVHFRERERVEPSFLPAERHCEWRYASHRCGCNNQFERVIEVNGARWVLKEATGDDNNCLIDTLRQMLFPGDVSDGGYLMRVRRDLAQLDFSEPGEFQIRGVDHPEGANFLEFLTHTNAVVRRLVEHFPGPEHLGINRHAACRMLATRAFQIRLLGFRDGERQCRGW